MKAIDGFALSAARGRSKLDPLLKRYVFFNEILVWHASGEEENVFPALENVAPQVSEAYLRDHRGLDAAYEALDKAVQASDTLAIARATAAFDFHLTIHLNKEDAHLYRLFNERVSLPNQAAIVSKMAGKIPRERFPEAVAWLFPLLSIDDQENMTRIWRQALPEPAFAQATRLIQAAIGTDWAELTRRIPELS
jgi:hypothetical protein